MNNYSIKVVDKGNAEDLFKFDTEEQAERYFEGIEGKELKTTIRNRLWDYCEKRVKEIADRQYAVLVIN